MEGLKEDQRGGVELDHSAYDVEDSHEDLRSANGSINSSLVQEAHSRIPLRRATRIVPPC